MVKVFDLYAIFHVLDNWDNLKPKLDTRIKSGQKVALEVSPANLSKVSPFIELCLKHDVAKNLSPKETVLLKELREKWSGKQNTSFLIELIYYLRKEGCEVIPIGSSFGDKLAAKKVMQLAEMERTDAHYGSTPDRLRKRKELFDQLEAIQVLREERAFKKKVVKSAPDAVIVGAQHADAFVGIPHRVVLNEIKNLPKAKWITPEVIASVLYTQQKLKAARRKYNLKRIERELIRAQRPKPKEPVLGTQKVSRRWFRLK